jgi:serine phosphatase RsbU (regulator of sigma subunit)/anti-sigma regulatory factor (Ser/Thr protein kinase)
VEQAFDDARRGLPLEFTARVRVGDTYRLFHALGELVRDPSGHATGVRGSVQDVTEQQATQDAVAAAVAASEAAAREQRIADELQRSLLPPPTFSPDHLDVATYYRAGVAGTYVGGDWYDVIELGAGRTALVVGDVMGRGVRAAAVMGQLRAAVRAYARIDLTPADVLEFLDGVVSDLGDDQIVTCVYAVYDPGERSLSFANAGHVPPLVLVPGEGVRQLTTAGPPLGTGVPRLEEHQVPLPRGAVLALYTDGLVETRHRDLDAGISELARNLAELRPITDDLAQSLVEKMLSDAPDDDVALLVAQVHEEAEHAHSRVFHLPSDERTVQSARDQTRRTLAEWDVPASRIDDIVLLVSELVTNAIIHGKPPIELRMRTARHEVVLDVRDHANYLPRRLHPTVDDEHGRGLQLVALLAKRWGTRPVPQGKSVWCVCSTTPSAQR